MYEEVCKFKENRYFICLLITYKKEKKRKEKEISTTTLSQKMYQLIPHTCASLLI